MIESLFPVYGPEQVTSGATSDLRKATRVARAMVKVCSDVGIFVDGILTWKYTPTLLNRAL